MDPRLLADIQAIEEALPMRQEGPVEGRVLLVDGDGLAYHCSGNDQTDPGTARQNLIAKVNAAMRQAGATASRILLTGQSSHKGFRYAIARVKPYQGQRRDARRPKNWSYLRSLLETDALPFPVIQTHTAEADDLFGAGVTEHGAENTVILTQDKDMRMLPGWHMDWDTHTMAFVPEGTFSQLINDKVYGTKWFWLQMLMGDAADNIPGLPQWFAPGDPKPRLMGPKTAERQLMECKDDADALLVTFELYKTCYKSGALAAMAEQGALLWMRRDAQSCWLDVFRKSHPLHACSTQLLELAERVEEARCSS